MTRTKYNNIKLFINAEYRKRTYSRSKSHVIFCMDFFLIFANNKFIFNDNPFMENKINNTMKSKLNIVIFQISIDVIR